MAASLYKKRGVRSIHRLVMEAHIKRPLLSTEIVHHINGDGFDNRLENLEIMEWGEHTRHHRLGTKQTAETKAKIGKGNAEKFVSLETREKLRQINLGKKHTPAAIENMRVAQALRNAQ